MADGNGETRVQILFFSQEYNFNKLCVGGEFRQMKWQKKRKNLEEGRTKGACRPNFGRMVNCS